MWDAGSEMLLRPSIIFSSESCARALSGDVSADLVCVTLNISSFISLGHLEDSSDQGGRRRRGRVHPCSHALEGVEIGDTGTHYLHHHPHHMTQEAPAMPPHPFVITL